MATEQEPYPLEQQPAESSAVVPAAPPAANTSNGVPYKDSTMPTEAQPSQEPHPQEQHAQEQEQHAQEQHPHLDDLYAVPALAISRSTTTKRPEEENWLNRSLQVELDALPKPDKRIDTPPELDRKFNEVFAAVAKVRPFHNVYQFWQYVARAMLPWGYEVKLSNDRRFVHCLPNQEACAVSPYDIHFNFDKKTYQLSRARPECASNSAEKMEFYAQKRKVAAAAAAAAAEQNGETQENKKPRTEAPTKTLFDVQWNSIFERLKKYREKYGNCCVPTRGYDDAQLAKWVSRQREYYNKNVLSQERIDKLNALGFAWRLKDKDTGKGPTSYSTWEKNFNRLQAYRDKFGNTHVPTRGFDDKQLAKWVSRQREYYNKNVLSSERINKLNSIGFTWQLKAGGAKKRRLSDNQKESKLSPASQKKFDAAQDESSKGEKAARSTGNKDGSENEVAALLTNLRHTSSAQV